MPGTDSVKSTFHLNVPQSDSCNYFIPFPKFKTTRCNQPNRVDLFDPEKANNRVQLVEYAVLIGDIRQATTIYLSTQRALISLLAIFVSLVVIFTYELEQISIRVKIVTYTISLVIMILLSVFINKYIHRAYRKKVARILTEHNEERYHRRGMHWNTDFRDRGWLHLQLNYNPMTHSFGSEPVASFAVTNTFFLDIDEANEIRYSGSSPSEPKSNGKLKQPLLQTPAKMLGSETYNVLY